MVNLSIIVTLAAALLPFGDAAPSKRESTLIKGKYIVTLKEGLSVSDTVSHLTWLAAAQVKGLTSLATIATPKQFAIGDWKAYSGEFDDATLALIKRNSNVVTVEQDQLWKLSYEEEPKIKSRALTTQSAATWGLGTVSHRKPGSSSYIYNATATKHTYAYIIDSGLLTTHTQFGKRASLGYNAVGGAFVDTMGHGTHVAGTIGGATVGVQKTAYLISVKVFADGSTAMSTILDGYNWAVQDIINKKRQGSSVISMSLGGGYFAAFNDAVNAAYKKGVVTVVAAGNDAADASTKSPASAAGAITVAAVDSTWAHASYSNYGSLVNIYAPGSDIISTWIGSNTAVNTLSGTSMATPHVAGLVLYLMAKEGLTTPVSIVARIKALATSGKITGVPSKTANRLVYNGSGS